MIELKIELRKELFSKDIAEQIRSAKKEEKVKVIIYSYEYIVDPDGFVESDGWAEEERKLFNNKKEFLFWLFDGINTVELMRERIKDLKSDIISLSWDYEAFNVEEDDYLFYKKRNERDIERLEMFKECF